MRRTARTALFLVAMATIFFSWATPASAGSFSCADHGGTAYAQAGDGYVITMCDDGYWFIF